MSSTHDDAPQTNDERIAWVLAHPRMSPWLKAALEGARKCHPIEVQNDLEILNLLLRNYVAETTRCKDAGVNLHVRLTTIASGNVVSGERRNRSDV